MTLNKKIIDAARKHAIAEYPKESCGLIVSGAYVPCENKASDPTKDFSIDVENVIRAGKNLQAVLHSHPNGPLCPSGHDMQTQMMMNVPWGIIATDGVEASEPLMWGDMLPVSPLLGRKFVHGVTDCYSIIRDCYRLGKDELAKQGIAWPFAPVELPEVARSDSWWEGEDDFYTSCFEKFGFHKIAREEARPGDVFLSKIKSEKLNHGGVLLEGGLLLHHLPTRLSRREPAGMWYRDVHTWIRHEVSDA